MDDNADIHIKVPKKYVQLAFEQGIPMTALVLRGLAYKYADKISNAEAVILVQKQIDVLAQKLLTSEVSREEINAHLNEIERIVERMVVSE